MARQVVEIAVNRDMHSLLLWAVAGAFLAAPAAARDAPGLPRIAVEPIAAGSLLAGVETRRASSLRLEPLDASRSGLLQDPLWRLEREGDSASGKRARLSVPVGSTQLFAFGGKLKRRTGPTRPDPVEGPREMSAARMDGGRVYGAGVERRIAGVDVSASYQYSRLGGGDADQGTVDVDRSARSHSLRATARVRFRP